MRSIISKKGKYLNYFKIAYRFSPSFVNMSLKMLAVVVHLGHTALCPLFKSYNGLKCDLYFVPVVHIYLENIFAFEKLQRRIYWKVSVVLILAEKRSDIEL